MSEKRCKRGFRKKHGECIAYEKKVKNPISQKKERAVNAVMEVLGEKTVKRKRCANGTRMHPKTKKCEPYRDKRFVSPIHSPGSPVHAPVHAPVHEFEESVFHAPISRKYTNMTLAHNQKLRHISQFLGDEYKTPTVNDIILGPNGV